MEGAIALPRMLPLERIPASFGREWALMPPHFSLRAEIRALYAALLRTVCLSADAFREACRWDVPHHFWLRPAAAPVMSDAAARAGAGTAPAEATAARANTVRPRNSVSHTSPVPPSHKLAGGACAIGGAALLAWLLASHAPHGDNTVAAVTAGAPAPSRDRPANDTASERLADQRAAHEETVTTRSVASRHPSPLLPPLPVGRPMASSLPAKADARRVQKTPKAAIRGRHPARERVAGASRIERRHHAASPGPSSHRTARRIHATATAAAGRYSPRQPRARQDDEWASIVTYAKTYTAPRGGGGPSVPVDSTEWVNHVPHRRVTDIPDSFKK